ncbi:MAG: Fe2+-dependent dioxygenase [Woeseiaceae bacterium]|nr:Fe2+-dependent dioxygenase [Woeseiaceae bacterium]
MLPELRAIVMRALNRSSLLITAALPYKILPPNFNRYTGAHNHYGPHVDNTLRPLPDGSYLRTDVSATLFLSAPDEYDGGELSIEDTFGTHSVKLNAGSLVIYPSGSIHEVKPVTQGERLACYMFIQSLVKDVESRRHLFEMDMALMSLRERYGDDDADLIRADRPVSEPGAIAGRSAETAIAEPGSHVQKGRIATCTIRPWNFAFVCYMSA